jgi:hypothetical protein
VLPTFPPLASLDFPPLPHWFSNLPFFGMRPSMRFELFWRHLKVLKASMVGFTLLSRSYYYLRRRSPGPPFPPDHRQAGERGAINKVLIKD